MTDQKPNCGNCTISHCPMFAEPGYKPTDSSVHNRVKSAVDKIGCLSHPDAREYLMKDVIEELERLHTQYSEESELYAEAGDKSLEERLWGERLAIQKALTLIKGGRE